MKSLIFATLLFSYVVGHSVLTSVIVNGVAQTSCLRPYPSTQKDYPISDITNPNGIQSSNMICGFPGKTSNSASKCSVPAGSTVGFQWNHVDDSTNKAQLAADVEYIASSHHGPCLAYMARSDTGTGPVWFKIYENGYDTSTQQWCVDKLKNNKGRFEVKIPSDLAPGNYIIRAELIALHEGFETGGAQFYIHCAEFTITGSGTSIPSKNLVQFPGAYKSNDPGIFFNIYSGKITNYPIPGPPIYVSGAVASSTSTTTTTGKSSTSSGKIASTSSTGSVVTPSTTGRTASPPPKPSTPPAPTPSESGSCSDEGYMKCASSSSYKICGHGEWATMSCQSGLSCVPSGNYIYCL